MQSRIISGTLGVAILFFILYLSNFYEFVINISVIFITLIAVNEILNITSTKKSFVVKSSSLIFSSFRGIFGSGIKWQTFLYIYTLIMFFCVMKKFISKKRNTKSKFNLPLLNICFVYVFTVIISICLGKIIDIKSMNSNIFVGSFLILITLGAAWSCDVGAFFMGSFCGKNKLCPLVSPSKTVEGAILGIIFSIFFTLASGLLFNFFSKNYSINYLNLFFFAILAAPISILGDLCFSLIKRTSKIKDFSNIIPGHGGILDRFDSTIFTIPYAYIFMHYLPLIN